MQTQMAENILKTKSYAFSLNIVKIFQHLAKEKQEFILSKQLIRSGTSIWALIREAEFWQSKADFINKMSIALKEANEALYRLDVLKDTWYINEWQYKSLHDEGEQILKMLVASVKTAKRKTN
jgi:four helix bundle protein